MGQSWILFALLAAFSAAITIVLTKAGLKNVDSSLAFAIQAVLILTITWGVVAFQGNIGMLKDIDKKAWMFLVAAGIATTLSTLFSYYALKSGKASYVTALERLSLVFAIIFSVIFLREKLTWQLVTGVALMLGGAILVALGQQSS
ncbi:EamA family transporter [Desertivirga brevis]|uniref:EamA family transporter n=1 Tax=Desertivirga brevis TaxID=2810310 RepID=UPI001A97962D|nr:EamA family transporter [Pedobacter sp. SYSU D00873]